MSKVPWPIVTKLCHMFNGDQDIGNGSRNLGSFHPKFGSPKKHKISVRFRTTSRLDCNYLLNATRYRQSENGVANYGHSHTGKLNLVYQQTAKNRTRVYTLPLAIVQRTGINKSVAFARWQQRVAIRLGSGTHSSLMFIIGKN